MGVKIGKAETVSFRCVVFIKINYGIFQAAGFPHYRNSAVAHGNHLAETAGFIPGGHDKHVCPCVHTAGQSFIKQNVDGNTARMLPRQFTQRVGIFFVAGTHHDQLYLFFHQFIHDMHHQVQPFGFHQTGNHANDRDLPVYRQPQFTLQGFLGQGLFHQHIGCVKADRDMRIRFRIIFLFIQTV